MQDLRAVHRQGGSGHFLPGVDRVHEDSLVTGRPSLCGCCRATCWHYGGILQFQSLS